MDIPSYSQLLDVSDPSWQRRACGMAALKMVMDYYRDEPTPHLDGLIQEGVAGGAYRENVGWIHDGLVRVAERYGFRGIAYDWAPLPDAAAIKDIEEELLRGPVIASVHPSFSPSESSHLIVVHERHSDMLTVSNPLALHHDEVTHDVTFKFFTENWRKRIIVIRPNIG